MTRHRAAEVRPRYGRLAALTASVTLTTVALLGGTGVLASAGADRVPATAAVDQVADVSSVASPPSEPSSSGTPSGAPLDGSSAQRVTPGAGASADPQAVTPDPPVPPVPADSGHGRRIVFSQSLQRVWLVAANDDVERTYLVSGSLTDNLHPGTYAVYSRSERAYGIDDSGTMRYFVRFTHGQNAAIGFHDIPVLDGRKLQTRAQLGTPQSHGCIRQWRPDAIALWRFAPVGTAVVVTA